MIPKTPEVEKKRREFSNVGWSQEFTEVLAATQYLYIYIHIHTVDGSEIRLTS